MSKNHLYTLRKLIGNSNKYRKFTIGEPTEGLLRDEVTKITQLFLHNARNPSQPTRIIAIPASAGNAVSWRNVKFVYMSDITMSNIDYNEILSGAFTRLANSEGYFLCETIPGEFEQPNFIDMCKEVFSIIAGYNVTKTFVDAMNPEFAKQLKKSLNEYHYIIINKVEDALNTNQKIVPVNFATLQTDMLTKLQALVAAHDIAIHKRFNSLLVEMRIAQESNGKLQKYQAGKTLDLIDALRMNILNYYHG